LWGEAINVVAIILNLHSIKSHPNKTLEKPFTGHKPWVTKLQIFNSIVFVHQHPPNISKLESHAKECILLRYDDCAQGYHCYQPSRHRVIISWDVKFLEDDHMDLVEILAFKPIELICGYSLIFFQKVTHVPHWQLLEVTTSPQLEQLVTQSSKFVSLAIDTSNSLPSSQLATNPCDIVVTSISTSSLLSKPLGV